MKYDGKSCFPLFMMGGLYGITNPTDLESSKSIQKFLGGFVRQKMYHPDGIQVFLEKRSSWK